MIFNNCHMFANGLSRLLTYNTRPNSCGVLSGPAPLRPIYTSPTCPTEKINAFASTYSHFKGRPNCNNYRRKQIRFRNNYCENMGTPIFPAAPTTTPTTSPRQTTSTRRTTLSVMDLARRMAREREEMMRRGQ